MPIDERWQRLSPTEWDAFARAWLQEIREKPPESDESDRAEHSDGESVGSIVTMMNFTARPEEQFQFISAAMAHAESDEELGSLAAGPVEHLLGWHGAEYIDRVQEWAGSDPKVARMLTGVWQYLMPDDIWARVRAIQARVANPLDAYRPDADEPTESR